MPRCHVNHSTSSLGKFESEEYICNFLNPARQWRRGYIAGLVGNEPARHVVYWQALGYLPQQQIMLERDWETYQHLCVWAQANNFPGLILHGQMEDHVPSLIIGGLQITTIECDNCDLYGWFEDKMLRIAVQHKIPALALTFTTRGNSTAIEELGYRLGLYKKEPQQANGRRLTRVHVDRHQPAGICVRKDHYLMHELVPRHVRAIVAGTGYTVSSYKYYRGVGHTGMATICITKEIYGTIDDTAREGQVGQPYAQTQGSNSRAVAAGSYGC